MAMACGAALAHAVATRSLSLHWQIQACDDIATPQGTQYVLAVRLMNPVLFHPDCDRRPWNHTRSADPAVCLRVNVGTLQALAG